MNIEIESDPVFNYIQNPWEDSLESRPVWFENNFHRFVYSPEHIIKSAVQYDLNDGPNAGGIYFLLCGNFIMYVGKANSIHRRLIQHWKTPNHPFDRYWCFGGMPEIYVEAIECFYIHALKTEGNHKIPAVGWDFIKKELDDFNYLA